MTRDKFDSLSKEELVGKTAIVNTDLQSFQGEKINEGERVTILQWKATSQL